MKRTIEWPPRLVRGGVAMTPAESDAEAEQGVALRQLIALRLQDATSANPWNQAELLGIDDRAFAASTSAGLATLESEIRRHFAELEGARRARLVELTSSRDRDGRVVVSVVYDNLEIGTRQRLETSRAA